MKATVSMQRIRQAMTKTTGNDLAKLRAGVTAAEAAVAKAAEAVRQAKALARSSAGAAVLQGQESEYHKAQAAVTAAEQAASQAATFHGGLRDALAAAEGEVAAADLAERKAAAKRLGADLNAKAARVDALARELGAALDDFHECNRAFWHGLPRRVPAAGPLPAQAINSLTLNRLAGVTAGRFGKVSGFFNPTELNAQAGLPGETAKHTEWLLAEQERPETTPPKEAA